MNAAKRPAIPASTSHQSSAYVASCSQADHLPGSQPVARQRAYTPKRKPHAGARQAIAFESSVKLTVNLLLAVVATTTIAKLVPYYQTQQTRLATLQESVTSAEAKNAELRSRFNRNFDPAQASRIMQEQSGMGYPNQKQIIWSEPSVEEGAAKESAKPSATE
ncbi:MAG: hypothetical protein AAFV85_14365 [Cyanobacteria bacterium J06634_6]